MVEKIRAGDILLDFDGTVVTHKYKGVGIDIGAEGTLKDLVKRGHRLILFTMRSNRDSGLQDAIDWFKNRGIELYGIQENPTQKEWTDSPKAYGTLIIDDTALGIPLIIDSRRSKRPFVDWVRTREMLISNGYL